MLRNILAVIAGLAVGMVVNMALVLLNVYVLYPMPEGTSMQDQEQFKAYLETLPATAFLVPVVAHLAQAFVGGWTAARIGASRPVLLAMIVGVISLVGGIINLMTIEGPGWMYVELPLYLVAAWLAGRIEVRRRGAV